MRRVSFPVPYSTERENQVNPPVACHTARSTLLRLSGLEESALKPACQRLADLL